MIEVDDAVNAAVFFSGVELEGRKIHVDPYRPRNPVLKNIAANASAALPPNVRPARAPHSRTSGASRTVKKQKVRKVKDSIGRRYAR